VLVPRTGRHPLFAAPVTVAATAGPSDRLAAFLGRSPGIAPMPATDRPAASADRARTERAVEGLPRLVRRKAV
jgi:hypothetical protein